MPKAAVNRDNTKILKELVILPRRDGRNGLISVTLSLLLRGPLEYD
jgi:hypothetical protein